MIESINAAVGTVRVTGPEIHIYKFSRLVGAEAGKWEKILRELEQKEDLIYNYYQPVRQAAVKLTARAGKSRDAIYREMLTQSELVVHSLNQNPVRDNQHCFENFENVFFPRIKTFQRSLLKTPQINGTVFGGLILKGLPHMIVVDRHDRERYVCLYPSTWKEHELTSYLELLTIVAESQFGASAKDLWCMELKTGKDIRWTKSKVRTRQKCQEAALLFKRMAG